MNKLPPKLWFVFSAYSSSPDSLRPSTWGTIFRLSFHTAKHSSIFFSVRGGTLIFGNKTLYQREGSSAPTEAIIILILGFKTVIGSSTCMEVIILLIFGYKTGMGSSVPTDGIILLIFGNKVGMGSYYPK